MLQESKIKRRCLELMKKLNYMYYHMEKVSECEIESDILTLFKEYIQGEDTPRYYKRLIEEIDVLNKEESIGETYTQEKIRLKILIEDEEDEVNNMYSVYRGMNEVGRWIEEMILNVIGGRSKRPSYIKEGSERSIDYIDKSVYKSEDIVRDIERYSDDEIRGIVRICHEDYYNMLRKENDMLCNYPSSRKLSQFLSGCIVTKADVGYNCLMCEGGSVIFERIVDNSKIECKWENKTLEVGYIQTLKFKYNQEKLNRSLVIY